MAASVWYIVDLNEGSVQSTNDNEVAEQFLCNDEYLVIHQNGTYFCGSRLAREPEELTKEDLEGAEGGEEEGDGETAEGETEDDAEGEQE